MLFQYFRILRCLNRTGRTPSLLLGRLPRRTNFSSANRNATLTLLKGSPIFPPAVSFASTVHIQLADKFAESAPSLQVHNLEDWYRVSKDQLEKGAPFLWFDIKTRYNGSIYKALVASFASHEWMPWRFQAEKVPPGYWTDKSARRRYFDWLQVKLEFNSMEDWYKITKAVIRKNGGSGMLMHYYQDNVREFVMDVCPEYDWKVWKFARSPTTWTRNQLLHKEWFESAAESLGFTTLDAWYNISTPQLASLVGEDPVTPHYGHSLPKALRRCYPDHNWQDWRFRNMNRASLVGQKRLLEHAAASAWGWDNTGDHLDRWYRIKFSDLVRAGLSGLITGRYNSSLVSALRAIYPNHQWDEWRFEKVANRNTISPQDSDESS